MYEMDSIHCESPVIIINPIWKHCLATASIIITPYLTVGVTDSRKAQWTNYPFTFTSLFAPKKYGITIDDLDNSYILKKSTGEIIPLYIQVPCGKCVLCRKRKTSEWKFRAVCENATSTSQPLFITLTYNPEHLPSCGIMKEEIQLFMKRLRIQLDRQGVEHNLRYFACGEYGHNSGRAHYHMLLWNFPDCFPRMKEKLECIENAWKLPVLDNEGNIIYDKTGAPVRESIGFCYVKPLEYGGVEYVMKYMKKAHTPPAGKNPCFFLSSRKNGGIGAKYAKSLMSFYRDNPQCMSIECRDPYTGVVHRRDMLPQYFKRLYFPSVSTFFPKVITDSYKLLCHCIHMREQILYVLRSRMKFDDGTDLNTGRKSFYTYLQSDIDLLKIYNFVGKFYHPYIGHDTYLWKDSNDVLKDKLVEYKAMYLNCCNKLLAYLEEARNYKELDDAKRRRQASIMNRFIDVPKQDLKEVIEHEKYLLEKEYMKEII